MNDKTLDLLKITLIKAMNESVTHLEHLGRIRDIALEADFVPDATKELFKVMDPVALQFQIEEALGDIEENN